jgi:hypothetical protein
MQARRSMDGSRGGGGHSRRVSWGSNNSRGSLGDRAALMHEFSLDDLAEDSEEDGRGKRGLGDEEAGYRHSATQLARLSGSGRARSNNLEKETVKPSKGVGRGE